jgi:hypothetical protein
MRRSYVRPLPLALLIWVMAILWVSRAWVFVMLAAGVIVWLKASCR